MLIAVNGNNSRRSCAICKDKEQKPPRVFSFPGTAIDHPLQTLGLLLRDGFPGSLVATFMNRHVVVVAGSARNNANEVGLGGKRPGYNRR